MRWEMGRRERSRRRMRRILVKAARELSMHRRRWLVSDSSFLTIGEGFSDVMHAC